MFKIIQAILHNLLLHGYFTLHWVLGFFFMRVSMEFYVYYDLYLCTTFIWEVKCVALSCKCDELFLRFFYSRFFSLLGYYIRGMVLL